MREGRGSIDDLLGILIASSKKREGNKYTINYQELLNDCKLFLFSGHETTSTLLAWTILLLSKHQDWQTRARQEILATFGMNPPDYDGLHRLKILGQMKMVLNEVLRLYPPIPTLTRVIRGDDTTLGNLYIPKGTIVNLSVIHAHHNPKYWGNDAKEFNPERFSEGIGKATNGNMSFFPFGGGPRICIGQNLALVESKMALSIILQRFAFELSPSYVHAPTSVITLKPQHGAHVILHHV
ncbi:cytochrome P450 CYP72A219-like [Silene latifolia]|uniref:cytochrome P450 CYP72A219-like n=1 Tax=Silene latifolia TaxID=37657 RepID=UPI003D782211